MIQIKNEQRYNRDAGEGGHPPLQNALKGGGLQ
jgi:hypothetical protein